MRTVPAIVILLGAAGLIPFIGCALGALSLEGEWARMSLLGLSAYAAVILSFLGAVHWGFGLAPGTEVGGPGAPARVQRGRFALGVVPSLVGWAALLVTFVGLPKTGLLVLAAGIAATTVVEGRAARGGFVPPGYMLLRWVLSVIVVVCLLSVVLVLALGGRVVL